VLVQVLGDASPIDPDASGLEHFLQEFQQLAGYSEFGTGPDGAALLAFPLVLHGIPQKFHAALVLFLGFYELGGAYQVLVRQAGVFVDSLLNRRDEFARLILTGNED
jgi:hypothetical protein